ncbi:MAG TPA: glycerol-3-phosphate dehydrogenase/oxidase [Frankiaceae bacterium]|nr:glycerol-3-phosphate dehydrogenase/oxidase [Frankiaceae bacterium]
MTSLRGRAGNDSGLPAPVHSDRLTAARRSQDLERLPDAPVDVLVVGGGVTGVGVALDAVTRGLSVALVERHDLAFGTSRWSSKLIHGGLRYLATGDVHLAYESARERSALMSTIAPHLVRPLPFLLPFPASASHADRLKLMAAARAGEALRVAARTEHGLLPAPRHLGREETLRWVPALRRDGFSGSMISWDGQLEDDARLVVALARTAAAYGARILTYTSALSLRGDGATLRDERTGETVEVTARAVVNATGVWADTLEPEVQLRPSKGTHVVLRASSLGFPSAALFAQVPGESNRYVFALPHPDGTLHVGLTDDPIDERPDVPTATEDEVRFLLDTLSPLLSRRLTTDDVIGSFAGLRPLVAGADPSRRTADLSRRHLVHRSADGVVTVVGGKLTTYRKMAEDTVDALGLTEQPCRTRQVPTVGAAPRDSLAGVDAPQRLVRRYGTEAPALAALAATDRSLAEPVAAEVLGAELAWGVLAEGALTVEDLLERRTRLSFVPSEMEAARPAAERILERYGASVSPAVALG